MDFLTFEEERRAWSIKTFGPLGNGRGVEGVIDHLREELDEALEHPHDIFEWADIIFLGLEGAMRAGFSTAELFAGLAAKQQINATVKKWPDWRTQDPTKKIKALKNG
jgi:hypothetical protein